MYIYTRMKHQKKNNFIDVKLRVFLPLVIIDTIEYIGNKLRITLEIKRFDLLQSYKIWNDDVDLFEKILKF